VFGHYVNDQKYGQSKRGGGNHFPRPISSHILFAGPEREKDLPDIYALLASLAEEKVTLLNSQNLFDSEKQKAKYQYIDELKLQMADSTVEKYVDDFHQNVEDEVLMIGSITLEDVQVY
jgi:hypothetical protein